MCAWRTTKGDQLPQPLFMRLRTQIFCGYALLALLVGVVGVTGYFSLRTISQNFDQAINRTQPVLTALHRIRLHATTLALAAAAQGPPVRSAYAGSEELNPSRIKLIAAVTDYHKLVEKYFPDELKEAQEIQRHVEAFERSLALLSGQGERARDADFQAQFAQVRVALDAMLEAVAQAAAGEDREFQDQQNRIESQSRQHLYTLVIACLVSLLAAIGGGAVLAGRISRPVSALRQAARKLGEGDLGTRVEVSAKNEIGELAQTFNQMACDLSRSLVTRAYVESIIESLTEGVLVVDEAGNIERSNAAMRRIYDEALRGPLQGRTLREVFLTDDDLPTLMAKLAKPQGFESRLRGATDSQTLVAVSASAVMAGSASQARVLLVQDITEHKRDEERLRYLASYDVLTGLPNRDRKSVV